LPGAAGVSEGARPARTVAAKPGRAARIMVVDDEPLVGRSVQRLLAGEHDVTALERGTEALTRLERGDAFDLILCDLMMPDLSGIDLYEALEQRHPETLARMVFITGGVFTERAREFLDRIPNPRLEKPFDLAQLRQVVGDALAKPRNIHAHV